MQTVVGSVDFWSRKWRRLGQEQERSQEVALGELLNLFFYFFIGQWGLTFLNFLF